jgi:hypothetical protein
LPSAEDAVAAEDAVEEVAPVAAAVWRVAAVAVCRVAAVAVCRVAVVVASLVAQG